MEITHHLLLLCLLVGVYHYREGLVWFSIATGTVGLVAPSFPGDIVVVWVATTLTCANASLSAQAVVCP